MTTDGGIGSGSGDPIQGEGAQRVERGGRQQYLAPTYGAGVSVRSVLIVILVMVALIAGAIIIFA